MQTPSARGGNTLFRVRMTSIPGGQNLEQSYKSNDVVEELALERRHITYLYSDQVTYHFMDAENYEQYAVHVDQLEEQRDWLVENMDGLGALMLDGQIVAVELPATVEFEIVETAPVIKGATATNRNKPATLTNGRVVQVPEYMSPGDRVRINTETGKFMARVR